MTRRTILLAVGDPRLREQVVDLGHTRGLDIVVYEAGTARVRADDLAPFDGAIIDLDAAKEIAPIGRLRTRLSTLPTAALYRTPPPKGLLVKREAPLLLIPQPADVEILLDAVSALVHRDSRKRPARAALHADRHAADKLSAIGQLVSGLAHELNNPLTSIIGYAQLVDEQLQAPHGFDAALAAQDARRIVEESERAAGIVRNLLAFAQRRAVERELHHAGDLVREVASRRADELQRHDIELALDCADDLPPVFVNADQLRQVLLGLVLNAEQALAHGRPPRMLSIRTSLDASADAVVVEIADNAAGIAPDVLLRVFDPFFTTKAVGQGVGLGLSLCYGIVRDHGGQIALASGLGTGTTASIAIPARVLSGERRPMVLLACVEADLTAFLTAAATAWGYGVIDRAEPQDAAAWLTDRRGVLCLDAGAVHADAPGWAAVLSTASGGRAVVFGAAAAEALSDRSSRHPACTLVDTPFDLAALRTALHTALRFDA